MSKKALWQLMDCFRGGPDPAWMICERSLQLIAWVRLSATGGLPLTESLEAAAAANDATLRDILQKLTKHSDLHRDAFETLAATRIESGIRQAISLCVQFLKQGVLGPELLVADDAAELAQGNDGYIAPGLADLLIGLCEVSKPDTAYIAWYYAAQLIERGLRAFPKLHCDVPARSALPSLLALIAHGEPTLAYCDPIRSPAAVRAGRLQQFDVAIAVPPIGMRYEPAVVQQDLFGRFPGWLSQGKSPSSSVLWIKHLLATATKRVVVGVPNSVLFGTFSESHLRRDLIEAGQVEAVIALPPGLLSGAGIPLAIMVLRPAGGSERVRFVAPHEGRYSRKGDKGTRTDLVDISGLIALLNGEEVPGQTKDITNHDIRNDSYQLQPNRYVTSVDQQRAEKALAGMHRVRLGDMVETVRPITYKASDGPAFDVREVSISDLKSGTFICEPEKVVEVAGELEDKVARQALKPLDIIVTIKGTVGRVGLVPITAKSSETPWVLGQSSIALRVKEESPLDARVLFTFLRSELGQELLKSIVSGAAIPLIQLRELLALSVPVPSQSDATRFIDTFERQASIQAEIDRLTKEQAQLSAGLWS